MIYDHDVYQDNELRRRQAWPDQIVDICQGQPRCILEWDERVKDCELCIPIRADDKRSTRQIMKEMKRVN